MVLKLDPRYRLLWRSPTSLQFGLDAPPVVLSALSDADDRMLAALARGVSRSGVSMIAEDAGGSESDAVRLLDALAPVLLPERTPSTPPPHTVALSGTGRTADGIATALGASGIAVHRGEPTNEVVSARADLAIIVAHFVVDPELHGSWLRRDVPHLTVVFGDRVARIGPVVEPGSTPCLYCLERHTTDADAAWPAIESQLWGQRSPAETAIVAEEVIALVSRYAVSRLGGQAQESSTFPPATSLQLDTETGALTERVWRPHPECACLALPENDSVADRRAGRRSRRAAPRKDAGAIARA